MSTICWELGTSHFRTESSISNALFIVIRVRTLPLTCSGVLISRYSETEPHSYVPHLPHKARHLALLSKDATFDRFPSLRHQVPWLATTCPDVITSASIGSQVTADTF